MRRALLLATAAAASLAWCALRPTPEAAAVSPAQVVGVYRLAKVKGDGWLRGSSSPYRIERIAASATLVLSRNTPDDGRVRVEISLDPGDPGSLLAASTPSPAFLGQGVLVGDSMAVVDTGTDGFVNALTLQFQKSGTKVAGHWMSARPASDPDSGAAGGFDVAFTGKQLPQKPQHRGHAR